MLSECILWSLAAALFILPVVLRFLAGDEPQNQITQEQDGKRDPGDTDDDGLLLAA